MKVSSVSVVNESEYENMVKGNAFGPLFPNAFLHEIFSGKTILPQTTFQHIMNVFIIEDLNDFNH